MSTVGRIRIKICCISSEAEAKTVINAGADAIGLVGEMPTGPGIISDSLINEIARKTPPPIASFLLTSRIKASEIIAHYHKTHTSVIQLVDKPETGAYAQIRNALPGIKLVQVIHVRDENSLDEAREAALSVDALLLDSGNPNLPKKILGGTGQTHNWQISKKIRERVNIPVYLAGGIHAGNVIEAIETVQPFGIDLCSGVRTDGLLDREKLDEFFVAMHYHTQN